MAIREHLDSARHKCYTATGSSMVVGTYLLSTFLRTTSCTVVPYYQPTSEDLAGARGGNDRLFLWSDVKDL